MWRCDATQGNRGENASTQLSYSADQGAGRRVHRYSSFTFPGCVTHREGIEQAVAMAGEAIELYIESLQEQGEAIPSEDSLEYLLTVQTHA